MLSYPFTLFWILTHTFFFFLMLPFFFFFGVTIFWCYHCVWLGSITPRSIHQATFKGSNVHTPVYFYIEKNSKCPLFLVYLYKKKPLRALKHTNTWTPVHQILCSDSGLQFCAQILCYPSHHQALLRAGHYFSPALSYPSRTARCAILSSVHSALRYIIQCAQRIALYYPVCTAHCAILSRITLLFCLSRSVCLENLRVGNLCEESK